MNDGKIAFATLVATPTKLSWSQAYTAGKLYAVLSLEQEEERRDLAATGKEIINALVEEYFTLEKKNMDTIKLAVTQTTKKIPASLSASFVVVSLVDTIVYAYTYGSGKILLKRLDRVGSILKTTPSDDPVVHAVSGYVEHNDCLILETKQFADIVDNSDFSSAFKTPTDAVEMLSPKVHGKENGGASAIVLSYIKEDHPQSLTFAPEETEQDDAEEKQEKITEEVVKSPLEEEVMQKHIEKEQHHEELIVPEVLSEKKKRFSFSMPKISLKVPFKLLLFLLIPLLLLGALGYGLYTTKQKQEESKIQKLFDEVYPQAQKEYDEGESLLSLNKALALEDFTKAQKIIDDNINKFPKESTQRKKFEELAQKVAQQGVGDTTSAATLPATQASITDSPLLEALIKNSDATYATSAEGTIYVGSTKSVSTSTGKTLLDNSGDWKKLAGLGAFNSNIYVLDKSGDQILKYLGGSQSSKSVYASGSFSNAVSMAIDSSIYVLSADGSIAKYTRGSKDTFSVTGLQTPLRKATRIFTNATTDNVYVLDQGNKRVVSLSKTGTFGQSYTADIFGKATDFDIHEKDKQIFVLSSGKIYKVTIP